MFGTKTGTYKKVQIFTKFVPLLGLLLALGLGLGLRRWINKSQVEAASPIQAADLSRQEDIPLNVVEPFPEDLSVIPSGDSEEVVSASSEQYHQTQLVNGIQITATNFRIEGRFVKVDVCFEIPDNSDWTLWHTPETALKYKNGEVSHFGFEMLSLTKATPFKKGMRCDIVHFEVPSNADLSQVSLNIAAIGAEPREGEECAPEFVDKLQRLLNERGTGIKISCISQEWSSGLTILSKPEAMSQEAADLAVYSLMEELITIKGPWVFTFSLNK